MTLQNRLSGFHPSIHLQFVLGGTTPKINASYASNSVGGMGGRRPLGEFVPIKAHRCKTLASIHCVSSMQIQTHRLPEWMGKRGVDLQSHLRWRVALCLYPWQ
mmetsp:Transcript_7204/g.44786  ORF Transcript_7204/g.44786 Transcript_7204/m.44786 type:complete len:103 (+) Transcript_7204:5258-5566(+)